MGLLDRAKNRLERDNSGGWDKDYKKYIRKSVLDRILPLPIGERNVALSYRRYHFPEHVIKNVNYKYGLTDYLEAKADANSLEPSHVLYGLAHIMSIYEMDLGLRVEFSSIKDWKGIEPEDKEFTISFIPVIYIYRRYSRGYSSHGLSKDRTPPALTYIDESGIHYEEPGFVHVKKRTIYLRPKFAWPKKIYLGIQGKAVTDFGYGTGWTDEAAYQG